MSENTIKIISLSPAVEVEGKNVSVTAINVVPLDENKKKLATQRCAITNKSCRYLFTLEREDGESINVSAETLRKQLGMTQKQVDKLYCIAYYDEHPSTSTRVTDEQKEEAMNAFLAPEVAE